MDALTRTVETNLTLRDEATSSAIASTNSIIQELNASTSDAFSQFSTKVHDAIFAIQNTMTDLITQNISTLSTQLFSLGENVTSEFSRWNGEIKTNMDMRHETMSLKVEELSNASNEKISYLQDELNAFRSATIATTTATDDRVRNNTLFSSELASNTSAAIARSNAILSKVIGDVNVTLAHFIINSTTDMMQLSAVTEHKLSVLNNSFTSLVDTSFEALNASLQNASTALNDSLRQVNDTLGTSLEGLRRNTSDRFNMLESDFNNHTRNNSASFQSTLELISALNISTTTALAEHGNATGVSIDSLNQSLQLAFKQEREKSNEELTSLTSSLSLTLQDLRAVVSTIASAVFSSSGEIHDIAQVPPVPVPPLSKFDTNKVAARALMDKASKGFTSTAQKSSATVQAALENIDDTNSNIDALLVDPEWEAYSIIRSAHSFNDVLRNDVKAMNTSMMEANYQLRNDLNSTRDALSANINTTSSATMDHLKTTNSTLWSGLAAINTTLMTLNASHEGKFEDVRAALHALQASLVDYMQTTAAAAHQNLSGVADITRANFTQIGLDLEKVSVTLQNDSDSRHMEQTQAMKALNFSISAVNSTCTLGITTLGQITHQNLTGLNSSLNEALMGLSASMSGKVDSLNVSLDNHRVHAASQFQALNASIVGGMTDMRTNVKSVQQSMSESLNDAINGIKTASSAEYGHIHGNISAVAANASLALTAFKDITHMQLVDINASIALLQQMDIDTIGRIAAFEVLQTDKWATHDKSFDLYVTDATSQRALLTSQIEKDKKELHDTIESKVGNTSTVLTSYCNDINRTIYNDLTIYKATSNMRLTDINSSLIAVIKNVHENLTASHTASTAHFEKELVALQVNISNVATSDRRTFEKNISDLSVHTERVLESTNSSLRNEMRLLSEHVDESLRVSIISHQDMLSHYKLAMEGNMSLANYRISQAEDKLSRLEDVSSSATFELAKLTTGYTQLSSDTMQLKESNEVISEKISSLQLQMLSNEMASYTNGNLTVKLASQTEHAQQQLLYLSQNCSMNSDILHYMLSHVNSSLIGVHEHSAVADLKVDNLKATVDKDSGRLTAIESQLGAISLSALKAEVTTMSTSHESHVKSSREVMEKFQKETSELTSSHQESMRKLMSVEQRLSGIVEYNLSSIKSTVDSSTSRTTSLVGEYRLFRHSLLFCAISCCYVPYICTYMKSLQTTLETTLRDHRQILKTSLQTSRNKTVRMSSDWPRWR